MKKYRLVMPLYCKLRGVSLPDRQGALAQSRERDPLQFVHVPADGFPFNVYAYNIEINRIIGRLDDAQAEKLVKVFGEGFCLDGVIETVTGGPPRYDYFGCNAVAFSTMTMMLPYLEE